MQLYRAVADELGIALENVRLFEAEGAARGRAKAELRRADVLLEAARTSSSWTELDSMLTALADLLQRACAHSRILLELWDDDRREVEVAVSTGPGAVPGQRFAFEDISAASQEVIQTRKSAVIDYAQTTMPVAQREYVEEHAFRLMLVVPMVYRERLVGLITVDEPDERVAFDGEEIELVEAIAAQAAVAIENARLFRREQRIATTLQEYLLHPLPSLPGLELGVVAQAAYAPELVGGDFSDVFVLDDAQVVALIGDVAGKGVKAAGLTETVRAKIRAFATIDPSPAFILGKTNELMLRLDPDDPHVTAFLAVLDPHTGHLGYTSAGHPAPVHLGPFTAQPLEVAFGPPLGSLDLPYNESHAILTPEDYLVLYTDGVTEARRGGEMYGEARLLETVTNLRGLSAQELAEGLLAEVGAYADKLADDIQIVSLRLA